MNAHPLRQAHLCTTDPRLVNPETKTLRCSRYGCTEVITWYVPMIAGGFCEAHAAHLSAPGSPYYVAPKQRRRP